MAVLYLENLSHDTADAYLADGLTEELTARLGDIERLRVTGRTATRRAQQLANGDFPQLGRTLGVRYLVEGSIRRSGTAVRVSVRLLRAADGVRVWGRTFDRTLTDILALQEEIASEVATNVAGQLLPAERRALAARRAINPDAYVHYLRGSYLLARRSAPALAGAVAEFGEAIRLDPGFAAAEARRAYAYALAYGYGAEWAPPESLATWGLRAADRAIRLDSTASDSWMALGASRLMFVPQGLRSAVDAYTRAVVLDPRNTEAVHARGVALSWLGEDSAAIAAFRRARDLDPGRAVTLLDLAEVYTLGSRFAEARSLLDSAITIDPAQARPYINRAFLRLRSGDAAGAQLDAETGLRLSPRGIRPFAVSAAVAAFAAAGDTARARALAGTIEAGAWSTADIARAHLALGEVDAALDALTQGPANQQTWYVLRFPEFDQLRADARFQLVLRSLRP